MFSIYRKAIYTCTCVSYIKMFIVTCTVHNGNEDSLRVVKLSFKHVALGYTVLFQEFPTQTNIYFKKKLDSKKSSPRPFGNSREEFVISCYYK